MEDATDPTGERLRDPEGPDTPSHSLPPDDERPKHHVFHKPDKHHDDEHDERDEEQAANDLPG